MAYEDYKKTKNQGRGIRKVAIQKAGSLISSKEGDLLSLLYILPRLVPLIPVNS